MTLAVQPSLYRRPILVWSIDFGRQHEASPYIRWHKEREHPGCASRAARQADRRVRRPLHSHGVVRPPHGWAPPGLAVHQRAGARHSHGRTGLEVHGSAGAHRPAEPRPRTLGPAGPETNVLLVEGGDAAYLCHWLRSSGLADLLPSLDETVWVGVSAGSMVMTPRIGDDFVTWPSATDDRTLGVVDFSIFPHLDNPDLPWNTMATAEEWASGLSGPAYAIDDETALKVVDGTVEVISEGHWKLLTPQD